MLRLKQLLTSNDKKFITNNLGVKALIRKLALKKDFSLTDIKAIAEYLNDRYQKNYTIEELLEIV